MIRTPRVVVQILGAIFAIEGVVGLIVPETFRALVVWLQTPPIWPFSVVLRAFIGLVLLGVALPARSLLAVRAVGLVTLLGAGVGLVFTNLSQVPHSMIWRLPSLALLVAGLVVVWGAGRPRPAA
jgi:hypothetical protein